SVHRRHAGRSFVRAAKVPDARADVCRVRTGLGTPGSHAPGPVHANRRRARPRPGRAGRTTPETRRRKPAGISKIHSFRTWWTSSVIFFTRIPSTLVRNGP